MITATPAAADTATPIEDVATPAPPEVVATVTPAEVLPTATAGESGIIGHRFVASSKARKYYYCDSDSAWHDLAEANLVWFDSEAALLATYPNLVLHAPCKD